MSILFDPRVGSPGVSTTPEFCSARQKIQSDTGYIALTPARGANLASQPENPVRSDAESDTSDAVGTKSDTAEILPSVKTLQQALGVARSTVYEWFKLPGCPAKRPDGTFVLAGWRAFALKIGSRTDAGQAEEGSTLKDRELAIIWERRQFDLDVKWGQYTHNGEIARELTALVKEAQTVLRAKFETELPPLYTGDPARDKTLNKAAIDEVCARLEQPLPCQQEQEAADE